MRRRRLAALVGAALAWALLLQACADPDAAPLSTSAQHPCGPDADPVTVRVVDVYAAMLGHLVRQDGHGVAGDEVLYLVDHAVPEFQETGIPEREKRTPAPASRSTAEFTSPVRRCLEDARFDGLPPVRLVEDWDDPAIPTEPVPVKGVPPGKEPRRYLDGRLFFLGGVPDSGQRLALAASSSGGGGFDYSGGLFVLRRDGGSWRVTGQAHYWIA
jgi:hypothetical protein